MTKQLLIFDFFAGTGSSTKAFEDAGHRVIKFELDEQFEADDHSDVLKLTAYDLVQRFGKPDFIWASPPCTAFSVASIGHHWAQGGKFPIPKTPEAVHNQKLVAHTLMLIDQLKPQYGWVLENPRGMLRKLDVVANLPRTTVTYCQYGETRQKPTDLWSAVPNWMPRIPCERGASCHVAAPRGSRTGTQGIKGAKDRSRVPYELSLELLRAVETSIANESAVSA